MTCMNEDTVDSRKKKKFYDLYCTGDQGTGQRFI